MEFKEFFTQEEECLIERILSMDNRNQTQGIDYLIAMAETNGVLLPFILYLKDELHLKDQRLERIFDEQYQLARNTAKIASELIAIMKKEGLDLLPIKSFLQFPYADHDLDVVAATDVKADDYQRVLLNNRYSYKKRPSEFLEPKKRHYLPKVYKTNNRVVPKVHLHRAISWNGVDYLNVERVWKSRRMIKVHSYEIPIPSVEDEILIMAAHSIYENKHVLLGDILQLIKLDRSCSSNIDWKYILESAKEYNWSAGLFLFCSIIAKALNVMNIKREIIPNKVLSNFDKEHKTSTFSRKVKPSGPHFPMLLAYIPISRFYFHKFALDFGEKTVRELLREFFAYTLAVCIRSYLFKRRLPRPYMGALGEK